MMPRHILGISAYYHDSAACLVTDGRIVAAAQEERFSRVKGDPSFPASAIAYCLREAKIDIAQVEIVGFYERPLLKFSRILTTALACAPAGSAFYVAAMSTWLGRKLWVETDIRRGLPGFRGRVVFGDHHRSHAASAFYPSPYEAAAIVTIDGVGEWATSSVGVGNGRTIDILLETRFPHSIGLLYSAVTAFLGFRVNSGEYKVMGLAPYGRPRYTELMRDTLVEVHDDGSIRLNMEYFEFTHRMQMTGDKFAALFGGPGREPEGPITQREMDIACSIQEIVDDAVHKMAQLAQKETGQRDLCLAGGVALNCVANGRLLARGPFDDIWVQPAAGDAGAALGIALDIWHCHLSQPRTSPERTGAWRRQCDLPAGVIGPYADAMQGAYLGPAHSSEETEHFLRRRGAIGEQCGEDDLARRVAVALTSGRIVAIVRGRMEFGPRSLGARSILGDPRSQEMHATMNLKTKFRESFRPFAPVVMREHASSWFTCDRDSPYMLFISDVAESRRRPMTADDERREGLAKLSVTRSTIPAVTHVDHSARLQTLRPETNPFLYRVLAEFYALTGCPVLINTSFNVRGEPIVCSLDDAYRCFLRTNIDLLVLGDFVLHREAQPRTDPLYDAPLALD